MPSRKKNVQTRLQSLSRFVYRIVDSSKFFIIVLGLFGLGAAYIALVSLYPMAFDEEVHIGIIRIYAELWNPFSLVQKPEYDSFNALNADPSWLFHYLMSFPYRLLDWFGMSGDAIIVTLRILNIAIFMSALMIFKKVLTAAGLSRAMAHGILALVIAVPVVSLLAAHVNYDNLVMLITAVLFYYAIKVREGLRTQHRILLVPFTIVSAMFLYGAVVKYAYLPIAVGVVGYLLFELWRAWRESGRVLLQNFRADLRASSVALLTLLFIVLMGGFALVSERYIGNLVQYGSPVPRCDKVLSVERCQAFGPFGRDYRYEQNKSDTFQPKSLPAFIWQDWAEGMNRRLFFAIASPAVGYDTKPPLAVPIKIAFVLTLLGLVLFLVFSRSVLARYPVLWLFLVPSLLYIVALIIQLYGSYIRTGWPVALNGRYLIPLLPLLGALAFAAFQRLFGVFNIQRYAVLLLAVVLLLLTQGGGALTYAYAAEPHWLWPYDYARTLYDIVHPVVRTLIFWA